MKKTTSIEKTEDMIYYHYTNLIYAHSIMNDFEIKTSGAEKKMGLKKPSCWFSINKDFEKGTIACYYDGEWKSVSNGSEVQINWEKAIAKAVVFDNMTFEKALG